MIPHAKKIFLDVVAEQFFSCRKLFFSCYKIFFLPQEKIPVPRQNKTRKN